MGQDLAYRHAPYELSDWYNTSCRSIYGLPAEFCVGISERGRHLGPPGKTALCKSFNNHKVPQLNKHNSERLKTISCGHFIHSLDKYTRKTRPATPGHLGQYQRVFSLAGSAAVSY